MGVQTNLDKCWGLLANDTRWARMGAVQAVLTLHSVSPHVGSALSILKVSVVRFWATVTSKNNGDGHDVGNSSTIDAGGGLAPATTMEITMSATASTSSFDASPRSSRS